MPKSLFRIIVFLLVPCLIADPSLAAALLHQQSFVGRETCDQSVVFGAEAIPAGLIQAYTAVKSRASWLRRSEGDASSSTQRKYVARLSRLWPRLKTEPLIMRNPFYFPDAVPATDESPVRRPGFFARPSIEVRIPHLVFMEGKPTDGSDRVLEEVKYSLKSHPDPKGGDNVHITYTREDGQKFESGTFYRSPQGDISPVVIEKNGSIRQSPIPRETGFFHALRLAVEMGMDFRREYDSDAEISVQYTEESVIVTIAKLGTFRISRDKPWLVVSDGRLAPSEIVTSVRILVQLALVFDPSVIGNVKELGKLQTEFSVVLLPSEMRKMLGKKRKDDLEDSSSHAGF